jgi:peptidoglycan lytic transglycosylase G
MTIRSGGGPRDTRQAHPQEQPQAHPAARGTYDEGWEPDYGSGADGSRKTRNGRGNGYGNGNGTRNGRDYRTGRGTGGIVRFLAFALVLAAIVLVALVTVLRPVVKGAVVGWADDNPGALGIGFVADMVREDLGAKLTNPASTDTAQVPFQIGSGETATTIAQKLESQGFLTDRRAFLLIAVEKGLTDKLKTGEFILRKSMTPDQLVTALLNPPKDPYIDIALRTGLRLEQITAKLETIPGLEMNPADFYQLAKHPTPELLADYPWLDLPAGASLEGYLWPATYRVLPDTSPEELIRLMLDKFKVAVGDRMSVPESRGLTWRQVLTLASLVERETTLDSEKPLIAGVFQNRLDPKLFPNGHLGSDVTVFYVNDTLQLENMPVADWKTYTFWAALKDQLPANLPDDLAGYNTYTSTGLMPGPIATPTLSSIDAALNPDTKDHYLYFLAKKDGSGETVFAKTHAEHEQNIQKYGQ